MIDFSNLIDLLGDYFKTNDTYKDSNDKGILERFIDICGSYFKDDVYDPVYNFMDNLDVDLCSPLLLNYIWDFFGQIPYAYGVLYDGKTYDKYFNVTLNRETWQKEIVTNSPRAYARDILKYAISLYKIRGTLPFYNILLSFYGMNCTITDPTGDLQNSKRGEDLVTYSKPYYYDDDKLYDNESDSENPNRYDENEYDNCDTCIQVKLSINIDASITITDDLKNKILLLLNRFRPINVGEFTLDNTEFKSDDCFNYTLNFRMTT